jgi:hypothetical protein
MDSDNMIADAFISNIMEQRSRKRGIHEIEENDDGHIHKKRKKAQPESDSEDGSEWENIKSPFVEHAHGEGFCFACAHIGENSPAIKGLPIQDLIISMGNGLRTTDPVTHYQNISDQYENTIRKPINDIILNSNENSTEVQLLPEWPPEMVKAHMETHHNDPELTIEVFMHKLKTTCMYMWDNSLVQQKKPKSDKKRNDQNRVPDESIDSSKTPPRKRVDPSQWKILKEMMEMYIKFGKSDPTKMIPYYKKDRFIVENKSQHPFFNLDKKNIYNPTLKSTQMDINISY